MSALMKSFGFGERLVRVVDRDDGGWFVARDVCAALELSNVSQALAGLDDDERGDIITDDVTGRSQEMLIVSESGMYALVFKSRKATARAFRKWVTSEVLPSIRKTGRFDTPKAAANSNRVLDLEGALGTADDRHAIKTALLTVNTYKDLYGVQAGRDMMMKLGFPIPGIDLPMAPAPEHGIAKAGQEGDLPTWANARGVKESRREATHVRDCFDDYVKWCTAAGYKAMGCERFSKMVRFLFGTEEHPEMVRCVICKK